MIAQRILAAAVVLALVATIAYITGRKHGTSAADARWQQRIDATVEANRKAVQGTDATTADITRRTVPELAAHTERASARQKEVHRAIASDPNLDATVLPADLQRLRDAQRAESRRAAEAASPRR